MNIWVIKYWLVVLVGINLFACTKNKMASPNPEFPYPIDSTVILLQTLPSQINESSGLHFFNKQIWTHNDSNAEPLLFQLEADNQSFVRTILLQNGKNTDWEDLALDNDFLYIGDFGNNYGDRQDLAVYKVARNNLTKDTLSNFDKIEFAFPDQQRFDYELRMHDFDCEAMISFEETLFLFSKNHINLKCRLYSLPKQTGLVDAVLLDSFDTKGMITGAAIDSVESILALSGYTYQSTENYYETFIWLFWDFTGANFFDGEARRINLTIDAKIEGICMFEAGKILLSSESRNGNPGQVFVFDAKKWME